MRDRELNEGRGVFVHLKDVMTGLPLCIDSTVLFAADGTAGDGFDRVRNEWLDLNAQGEVRFAVVETFATCERCLAFLRQVMQP